MALKKCFFLTFVFLSFFYFPSFSQIDEILLRAQTELAGDDDDVDNALEIIANEMNPLGTGAFDTNGDLNFDMATDYLDLDEADCDDTGDDDWHPIEHLKTLADMAMGYSVAPTSPVDEKQAIADAIILGLEYWYDVVGGQALPP